MLLAIDDGTAGIVIAAIGLVGAVVVEMLRRTKNEVRATRSDNTLDHGRVVDAMADLSAEVRTLRESTNHRFDQLGQSIGDVREAHVRHLEWHVDNPREG